VYISTKQPYCISLQKSPVYPQKSPIFLQQSPMVGCRLRISATEPYYLSLQKKPIYVQTSRTLHCWFAHRELAIKYSTYAKEPYIFAKEPHTFAKEPDTSLICALEARHKDLHTCKRALLHTCKVPCDTLQRAATNQEDGCIKPSSPLPAYDRWSAFIHTYQYMCIYTDRWPLPGGTPM